MPRKSRRVQVYRSEMLSYRGEGGRAEVRFHIECSPGTYVRELAARVGSMLGCGGVISCLRRLASGPFRVEDAVRVSSLESTRSQREYSLLPLEMGLKGYRRIEVSSGGLQAALNGAPLSETTLSRSPAGVVEGELVSVFGGNAFLGMHRVVQVSPLQTRAVRML